MTLITPEELADLEARTLRVSEADLGRIEGHFGRMSDAGTARIEARVVRDLIADLRAARATIRSLTARAEALEKDRDKLREALRPFASVVPHRDGFRPSDRIMDRFSGEDFGRAARLLPAEPDRG